MGFSQFCMLHLLLVFSKLLHLKREVDYRRYSFLMHDGTLRTSLNEPNDKEILQKLIFHSTQPLNKLLDISFYFSAETLKSGCLYLLK